MIRLIVALTLALTATVATGAHISAQETIVIESTSPTSALVTYSPTTAQPLLEVYEGRDDSCPVTEPMYRQILLGGRATITNLSPGSTYTAWAHVLEAGQTRACEGGDSARIRWVQLEETLTEREDAAVNRWIDNPKSWAYRGGGVLIAFRFVVDVPAGVSVSDIGTWHVDPSPAAGAWAQARPYSIPDSENQSAGMIMLYSPTALEVPVQMSDVNWTIVANPNPTIYGPGAEERRQVKSFVYYNTPSASNSEFVELMASVGQATDNALTQGTELTNIGVIYAQSLMPGIDSRFPALFGGIRRATDSPSTTEPVNLPMLMESSDPNAVGQPVARSVANASSDLDLSEIMITLFGTLAIGGMLGWWALRISGKSEMLVFTMWATLLSGWQIGWVPGILIGVIVFASILAVGVLMFLRRA